MANNPWQDIESSQVLFILDASHSVEETLLRQWLSDTKVNAGFSGRIEYCVVPIADDPENIPTDELSDKLETKFSDELLLVPVRVVWKTANDKSGVPNRPT